MSNDTLFNTQIASILIFIIALFVLYRMLVKSKDATIEFLQRQLDAARQESPDILLRNLSERIAVSQQEIERLSKDKERSQELRNTLIEYAHNQSHQIELLNDLAKYYEEQVAIAVKYLPELTGTVIPSPAIDH